MRFRDIKIGSFVEVVPWQNHMFQPKPKRLGRAEVIDKWVHGTGVHVRFDDGFEEVSVF